MADCDTAYVRCVRIVCAASGVGYGGYVDGTRHSWFGSSDLLCWVGYG